MADDCEHENDELDRELRDEDESFDWDLDRVLGRTIHPRECSSG